MVRLVMEPTGLRIKRSSTSHALPGGAGGERRGRGGYEAFADKREGHHDVGSEQTGTVTSPGPRAAESCYSPYIRSCNKHRISRYSSSAPRGRTKSKQIKTFD